MILPIRAPLKQSRSTERQVLDLTSQRKEPTLKILDNGRPVLYLEMTFSEVMNRKGYSVR